MKKKTIKDKQRPKLVNEITREITEEGELLYDRVYELLYEVTKEYMEKGYSVPEVHVIMAEACDDAPLNYMLEEIEEKLTTKVLKQVREFTV